MYIKNTGSESRKWKPWFVQNMIVIMFLLTVVIELWSFHPRITPASRFMTHSAYHSFHIPVMGLAYTIDTPLKVARFGISSVVSIIEDQLLEDMRQYYCRVYEIPFDPISTASQEYRAQRIRAYLDFIQDMVTSQVDGIRNEPFTGASAIDKYFRLLPECSALRKQYKAMLLLPESKGRDVIERGLREAIVAGMIDVNIMAKVDNDRYDSLGNRMAAEYSDALSSLRGFAESKLRSSVVLSAGYNPRLYNYMEQFLCFYPDRNGYLQKKVILKVSDYRSALIQGKILAKKGIWVSEFRIESGLNCGGHAFPTEGMLMGPILEEFKQNREALFTELLAICNKALADKDNPIFSEEPEQRITAQGGVGTAAEHKFLLNYYGLDGVGWGSPFLLVPEATCVDDKTLQQLATATKEDYYLSHASPLGVPFNNFRKSSSDEQRRKRIKMDRPGSPCYKKYLSSSTEFTETPICTASRKYQHLKIRQLHAGNMPASELETAVEAVIEKECLCEGLVAPAMLKTGMPLHHNLSAVTICPGPNLAYFSGVFSLEEMVGHIYGRRTLLNEEARPHMFVKELELYISYYEKYLEPGDEKTATTKRKRSNEQYVSNLAEGMAYYRKLLPQLASELDEMEERLLLKDKNVLKS